MDVVQKSGTDGGNLPCAVPKCDGDADGRRSDGRRLSGLSANPASGATIATNAASIINWQNFGLLSGEVLNFNTANGALLNRVIGGNLSEIYGTLNLMTILTSPMFTMWTRAGKPRGKMSSH